MKSDLGMGAIESREAVVAVPMLSREIRAAVVAAALVGVASLAQAQAQKRFGDGFDQPLSHRINGSGHWTVTTDGGSAAQNGSGEGIRMMPLVYTNSIPQLTTTSSSLGTLFDPSGGGHSLARRGTSRASAAWDGLSNPKAQIMGGLSGAAASFASLKVSGGATAQKPGNALTALAGLGLVGFLAWRRKGSAKRGGFRIG